METTKLATPMVEKEIIPSLHFPSKAVFNNKQKSVELLLRLKHAVALGNGGKHKIRLYFEDNIAIRCVNTTLWGITENYVILKCGTHIPIKRIHEIKFL